MLLRIHFVVAALLLHLLSFAVQPVQVKQEQQTVERLTSWLRTYEQLVTKAPRIRDEALVTMGNRKLTGSGSVISDPSPGPTPQPTPEPR